MTDTDDPGGRDDPTNDQRSAALRRTVALDDGLECRVRRARRSDLEAIQETLARSWAVAYDGLLDSDRLAEGTADPGSFYPEERFERKLAADGRQFLVGTVDGLVRGTASATWGPEETQAFVPRGDGQLRGMYLHPDVWDRGMGTALAEAALEELPGDVETVWVESLAENGRANGFYESLGFEPTDRRTIELLGGEHPTRIYVHELE